MNPTLDGAERLLQYAGNRAVMMPEIIELKSNPVDCRQIADGSIELAPL